MDAAFALISGISGLLIGGGVAYVSTRRRPLPELPPVQVRSDDDLFATIDASPLAALVAGMHDQVLHANQAAVASGLVAGERILRRPLLDAVRRVRVSGRAETVPVTIPRGVGVPDTVLTGVVSALADGRIVAFGIDPQPQTRVDSARRDFVANVSHELKTPIGAISLLAEAIQQASDDPDAVTHFAERLSGESRRLGEMVGQIIDLSRLQSLHALTDTEVVTAGELVGEALSRVQVRSDARAITIVRSGDPALEVEVQVSRVVDAIANLLANAVAYSERGGRVIVESHAGSVNGHPDVEIAVTDHGIGIRPEDQERIFERFYRVDYARSRDTGGTGLGLSIVKHVAATHGGEVTVWSNPGQGSTFTLRLPAYREGEPREPLVEFTPEALDDHESAVDDAPQAGD